MPEHYSEQHRLAAAIAEARERTAEVVEHDGGIELLIRLAQEAGTGGDLEQLRYWRELTYRSSLLLEQPLEQLRDVLGRLVVEVGQARDAEHADRAARRGLL